MRLHQTSCKSFQDATITYVKVHLKDTLVPHTFFTLTAACMITVTSHLTIKHVYTLYFEEVLPKKHSDRKFTLV